MRPEPQSPESAYEGAAEKFLERQRRKAHLAVIWAELAGLRPGMTILDIGSGPGLLAAIYAGLVGSNGVVYALEPSVSPRAPAPNLVHLAQDAAAPIVLPAPPDIVFITDTLHHAADPLAVLRAVCVACAPQTTILVTEYDPLMPGRVGAKPHRRMARETALGFLRAADLRVQACQDAADEHYAILASLAPAA